MPGIAEFVGRVDIKKYTILRCEEYPCESTCEICKKRIPEHDVVYENGMDGMGFPLCDPCLVEYEKEAKLQGATREPYKE